MGLSAIFDVQPDLLQQGQRKLARHDAPPRSRRGGPARVLREKTGQAQGSNELGNMATCSESRLRVWRKASRSREAVVTQRLRFRSAAVTPAHHRDSVRSAQPEQSGGARMSAGRRMRRVAAVERESAPSSGRRCLGRVRWSERAGSVSDGVVARKCRDHRAGMERRHATRTTLRCRRHDGGTRTRGQGSR